MLLTIGHSNHNEAYFLALLALHGVTAVSDVRSRPASRWAPHFSRQRLAAALADAGIHYAFLGEQLGGRSDEPSCYRHGRLQYGLLAREPKFHQGVSLVMELTQRHRVALLCAEKDPIQCHRALLVGRALCERGLAVAHILADGELELHETLESRLLAACGLPDGDLLQPRADCLEQAYFIQGNRVSHRLK